MNAHEAIRKMQEETATGIAELQRQRDQFTANIDKHKEALQIAQSELRPHSLIHSERAWQQLGDGNGVAVWGYAYDGGQFKR